jgi:phage baseplate assembly protein W
MPKTFLGVGVAFPISTDPGSGEIKLAEYEESVRQSVWIILGTSKGERAMRPDFGCGIHEYVFGVVGPSTFDRVAAEVSDALLDWEPRIDVKDVQVRAGKTGEVLLIEIQYRVRATNNVFNLIYPFYLESTE